MPRLIQCRTRENQNTFHVKRWGENVNIWNIYASLNVEVFHTWVKPLLTGESKHISCPKVGSKWEDIRYLCFLPLSNLSILHFPLTHRQRPLQRGIFHTVTDNKSNKPSMLCITRFSEHGRYYKVSARDHATGHSSFVLSNINKKATQFIFFQWYSCSQP